MDNNFMQSSNISASPYGNSCNSSECDESATMDSKVTDWSRPITKCIAGDYKDVSTSSTIYNKNTLTDDMWVELPRYAKPFSVCGLYQIQPAVDCKQSVPTCTIRHKNIWLRIPILVMDTSAGSKIYRLELKHNSTLESMSLYFGYTIQDDQPCKPYVYM